MHPLRESTKSQLLSTLLRADPELFSLCPLLLAVRCARSPPCSQAPTPCFWHLPSLWPQESLAACDKSEGNPPCLSLTPAFASQFLESPFCISLTSFFAQLLGLPELWKSSDALPWSSPGRALKEVFIQQQGELDFASD